MRTAVIPQTDRQPHWISLLVVTAAGLVAIAGTRDQIGGWNDASRLATVESLVDYHTLAIDRSIFVDVAHAPRPPAPPGLIDRGTLDKLWIDGRFYSDKSPVPALLMAGPYWVWQRCTGLTARDDPQRFVWWMTLVTSGLAYVLAVGCVYRLGERLRLPWRLRLGLTASFALATVAPVYAQQVNNHILLLAVTAALMLALAHREMRSPLRVAKLGFLAGLGYTIDLGAGPVILASVLGLIAWRSRSAKTTGVFLAAALPWLALHHAVNYAVGGTFQPANANPEYLMWPGSPFTADNITRVWNHPNVGRFLAYALDLLLGKRGFLGHNLPLFLAVVGGLALLRFRPAERQEILCAAGCAVGTWLVYAAGSHNLSGLNCSVRWFVPLLAPGYFVLAVLLREHGDFWPDFALLSGWGVVLTAIMAVDGPWTRHMVPGFWFLYAAALLSWGALHARRVIAASRGTKYNRPGIHLPPACRENHGDAFPPTPSAEPGVPPYRRGVSPGSDRESGLAAGRRAAAGHDPGEGHPADGGPEEAPRAEQGRGAAAGRAGPEV